MATKSVVRLGLDLLDESDFRPEFRMHGLFPSKSLLPPRS